MNAAHWHRHSMKNLQCNERHKLTQTMQWMPHTDTDTEWKTSYNAMNVTHWHSNLVFYAHSTITVISGRSDSDKDSVWNYIQCNECHTLTQTHWQRGGHWRWLSQARRHNDCQILTQTHWQWGGHWRWLSQATRHNDCQILTQTHWQWGRHWRWLSQDRRRNDCYKLTQTHRQWGRRTLTLAESGQTTQWMPHTDTDKLTKRRTLTLAE